MDDFSVRETPFSHRGSWFDISPVVALATYAEDLHLVSHRNTQEPGTPSPAIDRMIERIARNTEFVAEIDDRFVLVDPPRQYEMPTSNAEAEKLAVVARSELDIPPDGPCKRLADKVVTLGLLPFSLDLGVDTADAATVLLRPGGIAVINGANKVGRRRLALAHELGHYLVADEYTVDWRVAENQDSERRENLFDRFARAFLLPEVSLRADWEKFTLADDVRTAAVRIASCYHVDMSTLARRLVELGIATNSDAATIRSVRTTRADIVDFDLVVSDELEPPVLPREYERAVLRQYRSELLSAARAVDLLLNTWTEEALPELPMRTENDMWELISRWPN
ncbi:ImmA/IrrE family metallo-endopeptidase [Kibdelosporangium lantanae]|uniref:ImmA/IrrE family metallo-endopeptidase n=1 Tax=Kibdelosporangium lantanae TaxID=1497396 RepID=A0ABW3M5H0_9PSEU